MKSLWLNKRKSLCDQVNVKFLWQYREVWMPTTKIKLQEHCWTWFSKCNSISTPLEDSCQLITSSTRISLFSLFPKTNLLWQLFLHPQWKMTMCVDASPHKQTNKHSTTDTRTQNHKTLFQIWQWEQFECLVNNKHPVTVVIRGRIQWWTSSATRRWWLSSWRWRWSWWCSWLSTPQCSTQTDMKLTGKRCHVS